MQETHFVIQKLQKKCRKGAWKVRFWARRKQLTDLEGAKIAGHFDVRARSQDGAVHTGVLKKTHTKITIKTSLLRIL